MINQETMVSIERYNLLLESYKNLEKELLKEKYLTKFFLIYQIFVG